MFLIFNQNNVVVDKVDKVKFLYVDGKENKIAWEGQWMQSSTGTKLPVANFFPENPDAVRAVSYNEELPADFEAGKYKIVWPEMNEDGTMTEMKLEAVEE